MSLLDDFRYDVKASARPALIIGLAVPLVIVLAMATTVGVFYFIQNKAKPPTNGLDPRISIAAFTPGIIQVAECISTGPGCPQYQDSKAYMIQATPAAGLLYSPLTKTDPGTLERGTRRLRLEKTTPEQQWQAWAKAVTLDGRANTSTVRETGVTVDGQAGRFVLAERSPAYTGNMVFSVQQAGVLVESITYTEG